MQSRTFEWLRAAALKPDDQEVERRQRIVASVLDYLDGEDDPGVLVQFVIAACVGCKERFAADSPFIAKLVELTRHHQAAFSADLAENALDLQITCALVIGELLTRSDQKEALISEAAASLVCSTLGLRSSAPGKYALAFLSELLNAAHKHLDHAAEAVRARMEPSLDDLEAISVPADVAKLWDGLKPTLVTALTALNNNAKADREELEVLWWFYNRHSKRLNKPIVELHFSEAALVTAVEVADTVILPPHRGFITMIHEAITAGRKKPDQADWPLEALISAWKSPTESLLLPGDRQIDNVTSIGAAAFPVTWVCRRLKDSSYSTAWKDEFLAKTGVNAALTLSPTSLASQIYHERVAQRILGRILEE